MRIYFKTCSRCENFFHTTAKNGKICFKCNKRAYTPSLTIKEVEILKDDKKKNKRGKDR